MKLVNAGIKSKKELAERLINGEVFYHNGSLARTEIKFILDYANPFRYGSDQLNLVWSEYESMLKEVAWYEDITEPVICWVWDSDEVDKTPRVVESFGDDPDYPFTTNNNKFMNARPVTPDELLQQ